MKKITSLILTAAVVLSLSSCLKEKGFTDIKNGDLTALMYIPYSGDAGYFAQSALLVAGTTTADTFRFKIPIYYSGGNMAASDITYKMKVDDTKRTAYNSGHTIQYVTVPSTYYKFTKSTGTLKAGTNRDSLDIEIYPWKFDPTINYMLPITLYDASGTNISTALNTYYYHAIGNPLAGVYNWRYRRWNASDTTGSTTVNSLRTALFLPTDPTTVQVQSGYGDQNGLDIRYELTFVNNGTSLSNFAVQIVPADVVASINGAIGGQVTQAAAILSADGVNKSFRFWYKIKNSAGSDRSFIDEYYK